MKCIVTRSLILPILLVWALPAAADEADTSNSARVVACESMPKSGKRGKEVRDGAAFILVVTQIEGQGKGKIAPEFAPPESTCRIETFSSANSKVSAYYSPWAKGMQTLHYRFVADDGTGSREFLLLYNGTLSIMYGKGFYFYLSETRDDETFLYRIYRNQPNYKTLESVVTDIVDGKIEPVIGVDWPDDSPELLVNGYNTDYLK